MNQITTCDASIRPYLRDFVAMQHAGDSLKVVEEFPLYGGDVRADMVAMNGSLHGYEIKSHKDNLDRLPRQVEAYGAVFDRASLVVPEPHLDSAKILIPDWWQILLIQCVGGGVCFKCLRRGRANPDREGFALAALLWRPEALMLLTTLGLEAGLKSAPMAKMMDRLVESVSVKKLAELVRQRLLARGDWLTASRQRRDGETSQRPATHVRRRRTLYSRSSEYKRLPS